MTLGLMHIEIEGNDLLKLKGFLKHDQFAWKHVEFTLLIIRQHFGVQKFKTIKGKKIKINELSFYLVLTNLFIFLGFRPLIIQAFIYSCLPFHKFLGHAIHFCKYSLVDVMETYFKPLKTFYLVIAYY